MIIDHFAGDESPSLAPARSAAIFSAGTDIEITSGGSINIANNYSQAGGSIFMNAAKDINNSNYTVQADDDIVMNATNINNISTATSAAAASANPTKIDAGNMVSLNATNDITNLGATIKGGDLVYLTAGNDITNKALIDYRIDGVSATESEVVNSNANNIRSTLVAQGIIESAGNIILVANNDINNQGSKITSAGSALLEATNGDINITTSILRDRTVSSGGSRKKNGGERTLDNTTNLQSEITSGADLFLTSGNDITLEAAKLRAGTDSSSPSSTLNISAGNNLLITTATDSAYKSESIKKNGTFTFKNTDSGYINTTVLNTELSTGSTPSASGVSLSSGNATYAEFKSGSDQSLDAKLAYLKSLDPNAAILNPINEMHDSWNTKVSGLNQTGTIVVALTASLATGGALGFGIVGAMAGTAAATASVSATNASLNREGSFLGTLDDVGKTAFKDTTSKQTVKNVMVAGVTAGIIQGVGELAKTKDVANAANTAKTASNAATVANTANTTSTAATAASNVTTTANTANSITTATTTASTANTAIGTTQRVLTNLGTATTKIAINTAAYTIANSTINGESIQDSLKDQDTKLLVAQLLGEVGAKEIGLAAHTGKISQKTQLILHAGLGCGLSAGAGGGCASGAAAGVASEFLADKAYSNGVDAQNSILIGQATGAGAALLVSAAQGKSDEETAKNVSLGSFVGVNAVTNNLMLTPDIGTPQPGIDDESLAEVENTRGKVADVATDAAYEASPMGVNRRIERDRGSSQTIYQRYRAVYKSGNESNGVVSPLNLNIGLANIADPKNGQIPGQPVNFGAGLEGLTNWAFSIHEGTLFSQSVNFLLPAGNDMSLTHDNLAQNSRFIKNNPWANPATIPPTYIYNTYGLIGKPINMTVDYLGNRLSKTKE